jgi:GNAT superfamily N-acetyltransferase
MQIRPLDPVTDRALVAALLDQCADYIRLERDTDPGPEVVTEFFTDVPPGCDPDQSLRLGLFDAGTLIAIAEMAFGYPDPHSAYIGFLVVADVARGKGAGRHFLQHLETQARQRGANALALAVLEANPRGRAFWEREGFTLALAGRSVTLGTKTQTAHRLGKRL